ncbi:MAG: hypothetical protein J3R72DRAFT_439832 [Linnemannia gamsii]|nr:MAG: hypothetical protein J3R72DRAFT_439832 [Linnemannia gamsii]
MTSLNRQLASGAVKAFPLAPQPPIAINHYSQSQFHSSTGSPLDPAPDLSMDTSHPVTYDSNFDPASNNTPAPYLGRTFVHVVGPSQINSRRGVQEAFEFTTGLMDCFRDPTQPMKWSGLHHDKPQTCLVLEGYPYPPPPLSLAFVTAILAILKTSFAAILTDHPSQLTQSTSAVDVALDLIQHDLDRHLQSTSIPHSTVHIICDIPLPHLEPYIHDGRETMVQRRLTVEFYRSPEQLTTTWHRRSALIVMNALRYLGTELKYRYEFSDETYSPPLLTAAASNGAIQESTLESRSTSNGLEASMDYQPTVIAVSAPSTRPVSDHASAADDLPMTGPSAACFEVTGTHPFPPVPSRCVSLELWSEKWYFLEPFPSRGTPEPMLPGSLPSVTFCSSAAQSFHAGEHRPAVYGSIEQPHAIVGHFSINMHERCHSPENIQADDGGGSGDSGDGDDDEGDTFITETMDNDNGDTGSNTTSDDGDDDEAFCEDNNEAEQQQPGPITNGYSCPFEGCTRGPFTRKGNMKTHLKTHNGPSYMCLVDGCTEIFMRPGDRTRHKNSAAHNGPLYPCPFEGCNKNKKPFTRKGNLTKHLSKHNGPL